MFLALSMYRNTLHWTLPFVQVDKIKWPSKRARKISILLHYSVRPCRKIQFWPMKTALTSGMTLPAVFLSGVLRNKNLHPSFFRGRHHHVLEPANRAVIRTSSSLEMGVHECACVVRRPEWLSDPSTKETPASAQWVSIRKRETFRRVISPQINEVDNGDARDAWRR